jgi:hypothetical protein
MIIGISGRMGHGKNTVGNIIEKLCLTNNGPKFEQKAFAGKLKQIASILTGIPVEKFEDQEFKKSFLNVEWGTVQDIPLNLIPPFADMQFNVMMSVREFIQKLGTEAMRNGLHTNVWVNALFSDISPKDNIIITDMRFPNEMEAVVKRNGITIKVVKDCFECGGIGYHKMSCSKQYKKEHSSETSLDKAKFNYEIINDAGIPELIEKVRKILIKEELMIDGQFVKDN